MLETCNDNVKLPDLWCMFNARIVVMKSVVSYLRSRGTSWPSWASDAGRTFVLIV